MDTPAIIAVVSTSLASVFTFVWRLLKFWIAAQKRHAEILATAQREHTETMIRQQKEYLDALIANTKSNVKLTEKIEGIEDMITMRDRTVYRTKKD